MVAVVEYTESIYVWEPAVLKTYESPDGGTVPSTLWTEMLFNYKTISASNLFQLPVKV